jgi:hypothetical protein
MIKGISIFLSIYIFVGTALLPKGDFSFTSQLSKLYDAFIQLNGSTSFDEFLAEELLDPYSPPEDANESADEPFEKECHPVPIDLITVSANSSFYTVNPVIEVQPASKMTTIYIPYTEHLITTDLESIFHPPRSFPFS